MRITMLDGRVVLCEHKIEAAETLGSEADPRLQLPRYLDLPVDGVVYFRASWKSLDATVVNHPKYIRPQHTDREHFLWADLHAALQRTETALGHWMRDAFKRLGYTPAHPVLGDLTPGSPSFAERRENFFKLVEPIRTFAKALGWSPVKGTLADIWLQASPVPSVHTIRIDVTGNLLNIKIVPTDDTHLASLKSRLGSMLDTEKLPMTCEEDSCVLPDRRANALTITVPVADVFAGLESVEALQAALRSHVGKYIAAATVGGT
jgi:hypothetical protein